MAPYGAFLSIADGGTDIECCGDKISTAQKAKIMAERDAVIAGKHVFTGPLVDVEGNDVLQLAKLWVTLTFGVWIGLSMA